jgi:aromatic ring-opening dioxygenase catalytic subunit (LigB family)
MLSSWQMAPNARLAHPREEHLIPLLVAAGASLHDQGRRIFRDSPMQVTVSAYRLGESA